MSTPRRALLVDDGDDSTFAANSHGPRRAVEQLAPASGSCRPSRHLGVWSRSFAPLAVMAAFSVAIGAGVAAPQPDSAGLTAAVSATVEPDVLDARTMSLSRSDERPVLEEATPTPSGTASGLPAAPTSSATPEPTYPALAKVSGSRYSKASGVNVRLQPTTSAKAVSTLARGAEVKITAAKYGEWQQINLNGKAAWVAAKLLVKDRLQAIPDENGGSGVPVAGGAFSTAACRYGSSIENGITSNARRVFRAFCAEFPQIKSYGGYRRAESWSYHTRGAAIDAMVSDRELGWRMANWLAANADALNIDQIFYAQRMWTKGTPRWRAFADRGSITANHYDHVHISVG